MKLQHLSKLDTTQISSTILEISFISAQNLNISSSSCKSSQIQTYVVAYIDPTQKLISTVDKTGNTNPTWNDKLVLVIDSDLQLKKRLNACMVFEIYQVNRCLFKRDEKIGVAHVLLENLIAEYCGDEKHMALHVRSESDDMTGEILNIGAVKLFDQFSPRLPSPVETLNNV